MRWLRIFKEQIVNACKKRLGLGHGKVRAALRQLLGHTRALESNFKHAVAVSIHDFIRICTGSDTLSKSGRFEVHYRLETSKKAEITASPKIHVPQVVKTRRPNDATDRKLYPQCTFSNETT